MSLSQVMDSSPKTCAAHRSCGVYVGIYPPEYNAVVASSGLPLSPYHATGGTSSTAAGRISFTYALKVSRFVETSCVATFASCQAEKLTIAFVLTGPKRLN